jgi:hypothetical protein
LKKNSTLDQSAPVTQESLDKLMHAVALVILRRQMKSRWTTSRRTFAATL